MEVLFLIFWTTSMPFSTVAVPFWILTNGRQGFPFPHILASSCYIPGIFLVHPTCTRWVGWGFFSPHPPSEVKTNKGLWSIPSCTQDLKASSNSDKSSFCSYWPVWKMINPALCIRGRELGLSGISAFMVTTRSHPLQAPKKRFSLHSHCFADEKLDAQKKQWFVRWFLSGRVGTRTQPSFHPCCNSTKCWETSDTVLGLEQTSLPQYLPSRLLSTTVRCSLSSLPCLRPSLSQPHVLPVSRVVLLQHCTSRSQATGRQG